MELFRCERMHANITQRQCDINRNGVKANPRQDVKERPPCFSCDGCPGLGKPAAIKIEQEEMTMGAPCKEKGCNKSQVMGGFRTTHARRDPVLSKKIDDKNARARKTPDAAPAAKQEIEKRGAPAQKPLPKNFGKVENADGKTELFGVDLSMVSVMDILDDAWKAKRAEWLCDLSGVPAGQALKYSVKMLDAVEALGY